jgi:hypothetical protein
MPFKEFMEFSNPEKAGYDIKSAIKQEENGKSR